MDRTAILVDGGFYRKRALALFGRKSPSARATELTRYCQRHVKDNPGGKDSLYRIFYYDCPPPQKKYYDPIRKTTVDFEQQDSFRWAKEFHRELASKRKVAIRMGELSERHSGYTIEPDTLKKLIGGRIGLADIQPCDLKLIGVTQKGVDMRIGLDIASLSSKGLVSQIILISGDSDFVPAAKHARREGIDFILDPMWHHINDELNLHIDGLKSRVHKPPRNTEDPLHTSL